MNINEIIMYIIMPIVSVLLIPVGRYIFIKLSDIDTKLNQKISQTEVRQLIDDKFQPLKEDLKDLKNQMDRIFDKWINRP